VSGARSGGGGVDARSELKARLNAKTIFSKREFRAVEVLFKAEERENRFFVIFVFRRSLWLECNFLRQANSIESNFQCRLQESAQLSPLASGIHLIKR
jgi:hypothetical protein